MLSSSLVVMEKKSRAFFRNFTTPTSEWCHLLAGYITNFFILIIQIALILTAASFYLDFSLLSNYQVTPLIIFLSISLFILLGTVIGYMFRTQEGTTIASISLGSVSLFLSNLILPVESFPEIVRKILLFNPFVLCSELFKKAMLFNATLVDIQNELFILLGYVFLFIILVIIFQKVSFNRLFTDFATKKTLRKPHVNRENYLMLQNGTLLQKPWDLYNALKKMSDKDFEVYVNKNNNEFSSWIKDAFKERKLAKKIKKAKTQDKIRDILKKHIEKKKE